MDDNTTDDPPPPQVDTTPDHGGRETSPDPASSWRDVLVRRWTALGQEALGLADGERRSLKLIGRECETLAVVAAWFEDKGNITHASVRLRASRRAVRERLLDWRKANPTFVPRRPTKVPPLLRRRGGRRGQGEQLEVDTREDGHDR